jgi:hypothetical protein
MSNLNYNPELFWSKVDKTEACWEWTGAKFPLGYGQVKVKVDGKWQPMGAHRVAYIDQRGPIPAGKLVDHTCHNRSCVKPAHLRLVTDKQNAENHQGARIDSKSGFRGVVWRPRQRRWQATVGHLGSALHVGYFQTAAEANDAAVAKRNELFTHNDMDRTAAK